MDFKRVCEFLDLGQTNRFVERILLCQQIRLGVQQVALHCEVIAAPSYAIITLENQLQALSRKTHARTHERI